MKIIIDRESFLKAVTIATQVVGQKPSLPTLGNLLLTTKPGGLVVVATNLDTTITYKLPVKVEKEGQTTVPARLLTSFCQTTTDEQIGLEAKEDTLIVRSGASVAKLNTIAPEEFPQAGKFEDGETIELDKKVFMGAVAAVSFCTSPEEGRPIFAGVLVRSGGGKIGFVATDGYRLGKLEIKSKETFDAVIPAKTLTEANKALAEQEDDTVSLTLDKEKNQVRIKTKNFEIVSRLLDGDYPSYEKIIPTGFVTTTRAPTKNLVAAVRLVSLFARDIGNVVRLVVEGDGDGVKVEANTAQVGDAKTNVAAKTEGEKVVVAFNSRYLLDSLGALKGDTTTISFSGPTSAALLQDDTGADLTYVIMPVRAQN